MTACREPISLDQTIGDEGDSRLGDFIEDAEAVTAVDAVSFTLLQEHLRSVLATLSEREAGIVELRFGLIDGQPRTLEQVGRVYGITRERIRQIEAKIIAKLRGPARSHTPRPPRLAKAYRSKPHPDLIGPRSCGDDIQSRHVS